MKIRPSETRAPIQVPHVALEKKAPVKSATVTPSQTTFERATKGRGPSLQGGPSAADISAFKPSAELLQLVATQRQVAQAGGTGGTAAMKIAGQAQAQSADLDLSAYSSAQLRTFDVVADGKLDDNEIAGIIRFADVNDDGKVDGQEQTALDYLVGKDTTVVAAEAFLDLHEGRLTDRSASLQREVSSAEAIFKKSDAAHDTLVDTLSRQENDMRAQMSAEGIDWNETPPQLIEAEMAKLGPRKGLDAKGAAKLHTLEVQLAYAQMRKENAGELQTSYDAKMKAQLVMRNAQVENRAAQGLFGESTKRLQGAQSTVARDQAQSLTSDMVNFRDAVAHDPKIHGAFKTFAKALAIKNAVRDGKLEGDDVKMSKVESDLKSSRGIIERHTGKMEKGAELVAKKLADPTFRKRLEALPEEERGQILGDMHSLIADTKAGDQFFHEFILPGLKGKSVKRADIYDDLKLGRHGSKLALNLLGVYGVKIASQGSKESLKLMDAMVARALGIKPAQVAKLNQAIQVMNTSGMDAAKKMISADPELKALRGNFNQVAGAIAVATGILAASDLMHDPNLRSALGAAKGSTEIAEVLARAKFVSPSLARYATFAGRVGPPLDAIIGGLDGYKAMKRNDIGGAIGGFTQATGGVVGTAGVIAAAAGASGVGLPLAVVGGAVAVAGSLVSAIFGDSPSEKWLKSNAPEYLD